MATKQTVTITKNTGWTDIEAVKAELTAIVPAELISVIRSEFDNGNIVVDKTLSTDKKTYTIVRVWSGTTWDAFHATHNELLDSATALLESSGITVNTMIQTI